MRSMVLVGCATLCVVACTDLYSGLSVETQQRQDIVFSFNGTLPAGTSGCVTGYIDLGESGGYVGDDYSGSSEGFSYVYQGAGKCKGFSRINELNNCESDSAEPFLMADRDHYDMSAFCALISTEPTTPALEYSISMSFYSFGQEEDVFGLGAITVGQ